MIITKEQQEAWVNAYVKEKHTQDECIGFIDGINKTLEAVKNNLNKSDIISNNTITLTKDELETFLRDYEQGYGSWSDTSRIIVRFLGMDETDGL